MKIAVLLFGQPRFWDLSYESILQETSFEGCTTDYYFHFWDRVAYGHLDHESGYNLTDEQKDKIVSIYKPKNYKFTNYKPLEEVEKTIFDIVEPYKEKLKFFYNEKTKAMEELNLSKTVFEVCEPWHLRYYLGQFVSLQEGAKLIEEEYDYIFRVRTDMIFVTPDMYNEPRFYKTDKQMFYNRLLKGEKGIFCKYGDLQIWQGVTDPNGDRSDQQPEKRKVYDSFTNLNDELYAKKRDGKCDLYKPKKQYLHMKDWHLVGSGPEMLLSIKNYINTIIHMIEKSKHFLKRDKIDINWAAGEIVCGEVLGLNKINAAELGHDLLDRMTIPNRMLKIANKDTKQCILDRPHVRVLADSDIPLKEQYKKIIDR